MYYQNSPCTSLFRICWDLSLVMVLNTTVPDKTKNIFLFKERLVHSDFNEGIALPEKKGKELGDQVTVTFACIWFIALPFT